MTDIETTGPDPKAGGTVSLAALASSVLKLAEPESPPSAHPGYPRDMVLADLPERLRIAKVMYGQKMPPQGSARPLGDEELEQLTREALALSTLSEPLVKRIDAIREAIRVHKDAVARQTGTAAPQDSKGHLILASKGSPDNTDVPGMNLRWAQEYKSGSVNVSQARLEEHVADGTIGRKAYLAVTRETRVLDPVKVQELMRRDPAEATRILALITEVGPPSTSLIIRKKKG